VVLVAVWNASKKVKNRNFNERLKLTECYLDGPG
jgi:hypothetical protein